MISVKYSKETVFKFVKSSPNSYYVVLHLKKKFYRSVFSSFPLRVVTRLPAPSSPDSYYAKEVS